MPPAHDVIIIGAGFAGLSAAVALARQGLDILVLEARDRVGGRAESAVLQDGTVIDSGGQFFSRDMQKVSALVSKYARPVIETPSRGASISLPPTDKDIQRIYATANALREEMLMIEPDDDAIADTSVGQWLDDQTRDEDVRAAFRAMVEGLWNQPADMLPLWYLISNDRRVSGEHSELEHFLKDTMQSLAQDLGDEIGDRIRLATPVRRISHRPDGVDVETDAGVFHADRVIVAVPPVMAARIDYQPPLPDRLSDALSVWTSGAVIKILMRYERPFWRDQGKSGTVMWRQPTGLYACDVSHDGVAGLVVFLSGPIAGAWAGRDQKDLIADIAVRLAEALGNEAASPVETTLRNWVNDSWSGGAYGDAVTGFSGREAEAVLIAGTDRIQFGCSELASSFPCYVEGALVAGEEVAARILALRGEE